MAIQMAVFMLGSLLMLVAILGGGFEVKELKVPKVGRVSRLSACACGMTNDPALMPRSQPLTTIAESL